MSPAVSATLGHLLDKRLDSGINADKESLREEVLSGMIGSQLSELSEDQLDALSEKLTKLRRDENKINKFWKPLIKIIIGLEIGLATHGAINLIGAHTSIVDSGRISSFFAS